MDRVRRGCASNRQGIAPDDAHMLALTLIALLEGAFILSQSLKSAEPVRAAGLTAVAEVHRVLDARRTSPR